MGLARESFAWHMTNSLLAACRMPSPAVRPVLDSSLDPVVETQVFWMRYRLAIIAALLAIILGAVAYGGYRLNNARLDAAAATLLAQAKGPADYQKIIDQYPGSTAVTGSYLLLADAQRAEQKLADANGTLNAFINKHPKNEFVTTAKMAMAANLNSLGKTDEALEMYRRLAAEYPRSFNAPLALLSQVPLLKARGQIDEARRVCETVLTQYRESYASTEASRLLRTLKTAPVVAVPAPAGAPLATATP